MLDTLFRNARVIDGSGNPWFTADVGVSDGRIAAVGYRLNAGAREEVDISGAVLCPGFVDAHTHSDLRLFAYPGEAEKLHQGITTALLGQDGLSVAPLDEANKAPMMRRVSGLLGTYLEEWAWNTMAEYLDALDRARPAVNNAMLAPHGAVRAMALGWDNRPAAPSELDRMKKILAEALQDGACGLSTGLIYPPGMYADRNELVELCRTTGEHGGFFVVHMRNESDHLIDSILEVGGICLEAGCPLHISHLKVAGKKNWGKSAEALQTIEDFRNRGLEVTFDQYPYEAGSTMLDAVIPPRFPTGGTQRLLESLADPDVREDIRRTQAGETDDQWENWVLSCGWDSVLINSVKTDKNRFAEGLRVTELAEATGKDPLDAVCDLLIDEDDAVTMTQFYGCEEDIREIMKSPCMMLCSDAIVGGKPHPRAYGSTARFLGKYARDEKVMTIEEAVMKMTSQTCRRIGLYDRGIIRPGMAADITVFDPDRIIDKGTYQDPCRHPEGIIHVMVNGVFAMKNGALTGERPGRALRRS